MAKLQNPIKEGFETVNQDLRDVSKSHRNLGKALDKVRNSYSTCLMTAPVQLANICLPVLTTETSPNRT